MIVLDAAALVDVVTDQERNLSELVTPDSDHIRRAFALPDRTRVLDGLYVALAEALGVPLLTTDRRLARAEPPCQLLVPS